MQLQQICQKYVVKSKRFETKEKQIRNSKSLLQKQIEECEQQLKKHGEKYPYWTDELVKSIAEELVKLLPGRYYEILGPFGLNAEVSIHFYKNKFKNMVHHEQMKQNYTGGINCKSIRFRPGNLDKGELHLISKKNTKEYARGTIAEMNGMNYESIDMPDTIEKLRKFVR